MELSMVDGPGLPRNYNVERVAIDYEYWAKMGLKYASRDMFDSYREFIEKGLSELVLVVDGKDLRTRYGDKRVTEKSKPADFALI